MGVLLTKDAASSAVIVCRYVFITCSYSVVKTRGFYLNESMGLLHVYIVFYIDILSLLCERLSKSYDVHIISCIKSITYVLSP